MDSDEDQVLQQINVRLCLNTVVLLIECQNQHANKQMFSQYNIYYVHHLNLEC